MALTNSIAGRNLGNALAWYMVDSHWALAVAQYEALFNRQHCVGRARHRCGNSDPYPALASTGTV